MTVVEYVYSENIEVLLNEVIINQDALIQLQEEVMQKQSDWVTYFTVVSVIVVFLLIVRVVNGIHR